MPDPPLPINKVERPRVNCGTLMAAGSAVIATVRVLLAGHRRNRIGWLQFEWSHGARMKCG